MLCGRTLTVTPALRSPGPARPGPLGAPALEVPRNAPARSAEAAAPRRRKKARSPWCVWRGGDGDRSGSRGRDGGRGKDKDKDKGAVPAACASGDGGGCSRGAPGLFIPTGSGPTASPERPRESAASPLAGRRPCEPIPVVRRPCISKLLRFLRGDSRPSGPSRQDERGGSAVRVWNSWEVLPPETSRDVKVLRVVLCLTPSLFFAALSTGFITESSMY